MMKKSSILSPFSSKYCGIYPGWLETWNSSLNDLLTHKQVLGTIAQLQKQKSQAGRLWDRSWQKTLFKVLYVGVTHKRVNLTFPILQTRPLEYKGQISICTRNPRMVPFKRQEGRSIFVLCRVGRVSWNTRHHVGQHRASLEVLSECRAWSGRCGGCIWQASGCFYQAGDQEGERLTNAWAPAGEGEPAWEYMEGFPGELHWGLQSELQELEPWVGHWGAVGQQRSTPIHDSEEVYVRTPFLPLAVVAALPQVRAVVAWMRPRTMLALTPNRAVVSVREGDCLSQPTAARAGQRNNWEFWKPAQRRLS